jgi:hypothetical protein
VDRDDVFAWLIDHLPLDRLRDAPYIVAQLERLITGHDAERTIYEDEEAGCASGVIGFGDDIEVGGTR